jgi:hypothetical protein
MSGVRELLAVVLGALLGVVLIVAPQTALRLSVFVGPTRRRRDDYGTDKRESLSDQGTWLIRGLGVVCLAIALFIAYQTYA